MSRSNGSAALYERMGNELDTIHRMGGLNKDEWNRSKD